MVLLAEFDKLIAKDVETVSVPTAANTSSRKISSLDLLTR
jgi:hypothetical protein